MSEASASAKKHGKQCSNFETAIRPFKSHEATLYSHDDTTGLGARKLLSKVDMFCVFITFIGDKVSREPKAAKCMAYIALTHPCSDALSSVTPEFSPIHEDLDKLCVKVSVMKSSLPALPGSRSNLARLLSSPLVA